MGKNVITVAPGGHELVRSEEDAALLGSSVQDPLVHEGDVAGTQRRKMFDTVQDKLTTFGEGVVNGWMGGWLHETGEEADLRRDVNGTEAFGGEALGTALGFLTGGPAKEIAQLGERGGALAARGLLRQSEKSIAAKALMEAGAGVTLTTSNAMGHAVLDTLVEDKPFAAETIIDSMKMGGLLGLATGGIIGTFGKLASTGKSTLAGTGFAGTMADALEAHEVGRAAFGEALHFHEAQLGAMKELRRIGKLSEVSDDFIRVRQDAVNAARRAQKALKEIDPEAALSGKDPGAYKALQRRWTEYHGAMDQLDGVMGIHPAERAGMAAREMDTTGNVARTTPTERMEPTGPFEPTREHLTDMVEPVPVQDVYGIDKRPGGFADNGLTDMADLHAPNTVTDIPLTPHDQGAGLNAMTQDIIDREAAAAAAPDNVGGGADWGAMNEAGGNNAEFRGIKTEDFEKYNNPAHDPEFNARSNKLAASLARMLAREGEGIGLTAGEAVEGTASHPMMRIGEDAIGTRSYPETGPFQQYRPFEGPNLGNTFRGATEPMGRSPWEELQTGPVPRGPQDFTGPGERFQPDFRTQIDMEEAALSDRAGNVQAQRAKMFRDARAANAARDLTQPGAPVDMTQEYTGPFEGEQPLGSHNPTERIERPAMGSHEDTVETPREDQTQRLPDREDIARKMLDQWEAASASRPWDLAKAKTQQAMDELFNKAGGRMTSASALGILEHEGIRPSTDLVGSYMDSVYAMNRAGRLAGAEAKGVATPLRSAMMKAMGGKVTRMLLGNAVGGPVGALLGYTKFGGKLASQSAGLAQAVVDSVNKALSTTATRSLVAASASIAKNTPWEYSDKGPIKDPIERIQEIQFLASNPDGIRQRVFLKAGPLALVAPELVQATADTAVNHVQQLALRAPAIVMNRLGFPINPPAGKMRQFFEFENAINDVGTILDSLAKGNLTQPQADAFKFYPSVHVKAAAAYFMDPDKLRDAPQSILRQAEMVTGAPFTIHSDPMAVVRQQTQWQPAQPPAPPSKAQALNINPDGAPTPSQANATGRAPGN